ncbi:conserved protein of unknown function [Methylorubrum extorquens]|uniref:Uncharacterized protein n=1 Tax=Methylorubrum extorquens TaxID=408 RepID=A0A2N9AJV2_METEX|nr:MULTISPECIES: hypothetical protein [Methylobacteriaceae]KQQ15980.1 hypothetical protein ASF56_23570 [Methylobacterium sp. Leaf122]WHQ69562.1 hypothetical protein KEC54_25040 [Methylorubrum extorquens]SOR27625.1 conserved protein of unknown function [Methylorubrum extorquens]
MTSTREAMPPAVDDSLGKRISNQGNPDRAAEAAPGQRLADENMEERQDQLLDEAVEETFPASDPISPKRITK